jgi:hypothetical protein
MGDIVDSRAGVFKEEGGIDSASLVAWRVGMTILEPYSYSVPGPHRLSKNSSTAYDCRTTLPAYIGGPVRQPHAGVNFILPASEAKIEIEAKILLSEKKACFHLFHIEAEHQKSEAKTNVK